MGVILTDVLECIVHMKFGFSIGVEYLIVSFMPSPIVDVITWTMFRSCDLKLAM